MANALGKIDWNNFQLADLLPQPDAAGANAAGQPPMADATQAAVDNIATAPAATPQLQDLTGAPPKPAGALGTVQAPAKPSPIERNIADVDAKLQADSQKRPWGSKELKPGDDPRFPNGAPANHPGVMGKILHGLAMAGNVAGDIFAPSTMALIPGTQLHGEMEHNAQLQQLQQLTQEQMQQTASKSENDLRNAQARKTGVEADAQPALDESEINLRNAQIANLLHPQAKTDFEAWLQQNPGKPIEDWLKAQQNAKEPPLANRTEQLNQLLTSRYRVLHPGAALPAQFALPEGATPKDYERIDKSLEAEEKASATIAQQEEANAFRRQALALSQQRINISLQGATAKEDKATQTATLKAYTPAMDSAERFNIMSGNFENAVKSHDQQAMLSLLYNHLGMTMGLQKGARMSQDLIREAEHSQPWLQGIQTKFDKDGYLSGVTLSVPQMKQMVGLARERYSEDVVNARNKAQYMGATDDGPKRTPNAATRNMYKSMTGGDGAKAMALAKADGWSVE